MHFRVTTALAALAAATPALAEVNIYSQRQPELIAPITDAFTAATGIETNVVYLDQGLTERLEAEGSRSPADIVMTVDIARVSQTVEAGVTQPVESAVLHENIPEAFRGADNSWFAVTSRARIVYASKDRVADGEITTYEDLTDPKWQGRICTRSGTHPYNLALLSAMIAHHGADEAKVWAEGIKANLARKPQGNDRAQVKAIWAGECDIALGNTYYMGKMLEDPEQTEWANSVRIVFPVFEDGGTHMNISGVAMTAAAPHPEDALTFMEFLASPEAQAVYAEVNYEFPVTPGVPASKLVASWGTFTPDTISLDSLPPLRADALRIMEEVNFDG
ncbi:Fe(3+) ABC transporter substrate-binding protein [Puniceibacterium sp. IMCC21224]|uniref:Fe(3+) ABC transporter substrate-binding protein n=1 Tax=Puniceibacterium sp. IMCC21224 TaxID=1618204 RepID=UPI00064D7E1B|nr:Fe(3+) ABC transporter substrate-binding protein [Puniceibacterium sp. IMCC21224]KMK67020.1 ABC-type Fe3+ transport system, periplasmic component [Puniceibacterium sp. IMCC21224]